MADDFWAKALGNPAPRAVQQPVYPGYQQAPPQQVVRSPQGYANPQGYAIDVPSNQGEEIATHILTEGFIAQPPEWVRQQSHDRCPQCNGANYALISGAGQSGQYGGRVRIGGSQVEFRRCFNCGFSASDIHQGARNMYSGMRGSGPVVRGARQTGTGGANLTNFGEIPT
jgi:hypothetical protein